MSPGGRYLKEIKNWGQGNTVSNTVKNIRCRIQGPESLHIFDVGEQSDWTITGDTALVW